MKVATIMPTPLLDAVPQDYNMCLYHVVKDNPEYANYFRKAREAGKFVIMDNGAAEGVNPTAEELAPIYELVQPNEIVLPDVVYDKHETLRRSQEAYCLFKDMGLHRKYQFMAVPQGSNFGEWLECMKDMIRQPSITTIGVSKFVTPRFAVEMGKDANVRLECVDAILQEAHTLDRDIQIHLLGCYDNPKEIGEINAVFGDTVRGTDSAIAYVYTRAGVEYQPEIDRPDNIEIDFHKGNVEDLELLERNINSWREHCQG